MKCVLNMTENKPSLVDTLVIFSFITVTHQYIILYISIELHSVSCFTLHSRAHWSMTTLPNVAVFLFHVRLQNTISGTKVSI